METCVGFCSSMSMLVELETCFSRCPAGYTGSRPYMFVFESVGPGTLTPDLDLASVGLACHMLVVWTLVRAGGFSATVRVSMHGNCSS